MKIDGVKVKAGTRVLYRSRSKRNNKQNGVYIVKNEKKKLKTKRKLLGVGHPYFWTPSKYEKFGWPIALTLLTKDRGDPKKISTCDIGAWKKIRVYLEWE